MSSTYTPNLGLRKPSHADPDTYNSWDAVINTNMDYVDTAYGPRSYTGVPPNGHYIQASDSHSLSLNKLDLALYAVAINGPSTAEKAGLDNALGGVPSAGNPFVLKDYVRVNRKEILWPEFNGGTFKLAPGGANTGNMITDSETVANYRYNHYKWVSSELALQSYDISVQWRVPETFLNWLTKALSIDLCTQTNDPLDGKIDAYVYKDGAAADVSRLNIVSTVAATWYDERHNSDLITFSAADLGTTLGLGAGDNVNITIRVYSKGDSYVKVGAITIGYCG